MHASGRSRAGSVVRSLATAATAPIAEVRIERVGAGTVNAWRQVTVVAAASSDETGVSVDQLALAELAAAIEDMLEARDFDRYFAFLNGELAGTASLRMHGAVAQLTGSATLPQTSSRSACGFDRYPARGGTRAWCRPRRHHDRPGISVASERDEARVCARVRAGNFGVAGDVASSSVSARRARARRGLRALIATKRRRGLAWLREVEHPVHRCLVGQPGLRSNGNALGDRACSAAAQTRVAAVDGLLAVLGRQRRHHTSLV